MPDFSPDELRRWNAWRGANAVSARRSDRLVRLTAGATLAAALVTFAVAFWR